MAWSDIFGIFRAQDKRHSARHEEGEAVSPESTALRRVLQAPPVELPRVSVLLQGAAEPERKPVEEVIRPRPSARRTIADILPSFAQNSRDPVSPSFGEASAPAEPEPIPEPEAGLPPIAPLASPVFPASPVIPPAPVAPAPEPVLRTALPEFELAPPVILAPPPPVSETEDLAQRWASARRSGFRPSYVSPPPELPVPASPWDAGKKALAYDITAAPAEIPSTPAPLDAAPDIIPPDSAPGLWKPTGVAAAPDTQPETPQPPYPIIETRTAVPVEAEPEQQQYPIEILALHEHVPASEPSGLPEDRSISEPEVGDELSQLASPTEAGASNTVAEVPEVLYSDVSQVTATVPEAPPARNAKQPLTSWETSTSEPDSSTEITTTSHSASEWTPSYAANGASRFAMLRTIADRWNHPLPVRRFLVAAGTRSEARRLAPVIRALRSRISSEGETDPVCVCAVGENPHTVREALELLDITVDCHLNIESAAQNPDVQRARLLNSFESVFSQVKPQWLLVAGDTVISAMASLAAYHSGIHVARVDTGPMASRGDELHPEEMYRQLVGLFASVHFTETEWSKEVLLHEGVPEGHILVIGNTSVDALYESCVRLGLSLNAFTPRSSGVTNILITVGHRPMAGGAISELCRAIGNLAVLVPGLYEFVWHLPPDAKTAEAVHKILGRVPGVQLKPSPGYEQFLRHLSTSDFVLTDSTDLQEEAPSLGKPVLLMGGAAERMEAVRTGVAIPVANDSSSIQSAIRGLARKLSSRHGQITNPYGDGKASSRIVDFFAGLRVLEFGKTALPRLVAAGEEPLQLPEPVSRWRLESRG